MGKCKFAFFFALVAGLLTGLAPVRADVSYLKKSDTSVTGKDSELGVSFLAETDEIGADKVQIHLPGGRMVEVWLDRNAGSLSVKSFNEAGQDPAEISTADVAMAQLLLAELAQLAPSSPIEFTLVSTLNLITEVRPGSTLDIQTQWKAEHAEKTIKSLCSSAGKKIKATYDDDEKNKTFTESVLLGPCYNAQNNCLGRCGIGCGVLGSGIVQQLSQDCLNHDLCRLRTGANATAPCDDEFVAASDDFFVAADCASMTGAWSDQFKFSYKLTQNPNGLVGGQVISQRCGSYRVSGVHSDSKANFTASRFFPPSGCCSSFSFEGSYAGCSRISGRWTNRCGLAGSLKLTRGKGKEATQEGKEANPFDIGSEEESNEP